MEKISELNEREKLELMAVICDGCLRVRGNDGIKCELFGPCCQNLADELLCHGYRQMSVVVSEAFEKLIASIKDNVTGANVDFFSMIKCYIVQIENEYIKRCWK